jgi:DUF1009 family protein
MQIKKGKLAIIAGEGDLVLSIIESCKTQNINFFLIGIKEFYKNLAFPPDVFLSLNNIGNIFSTLSKANIKYIIFIGKVNKPSLLRLRPSVITIYYILLILLHYFKGDNALLSKIYNIFIRKGFKVLDVRKLLKKNIANDKNNNYKKFKKKITLDQITYYFNIAKRNGSLDRGQSVIVDKNQILLREDRKGTDNLILRYKLLNKSDNFSLLVKICKPNQNIYFDLPTIGPKTINNIFLSGIKGIIVEKKNSLIVNPDETFKLINKYNLFYYAV